MTPGSNKVTLFDGRDPKNIPFGRPSRNSERKAAPKVAWPYVM